VITTVADCTPGRLQVIVAAVVVRPGEVVPGIGDDSSVTLPPRSTEVLRAALDARGIRWGEQ
jgi:hypothetical protein